MSIATEITRLQGAKADLKTAIENKGVTVSSSALLDAYPALVTAIPTEEKGYTEWPSDAPTHSALSAEATTWKNNTGVQGDVAYIIFKGSQIDDVYVSSLSNTAAYVYFSDTQATESFEIEAGTGTIPLSNHIWQSQTGYNYVLIGGNVTTLRIFGFKDWNFFFSSTANAIKIASAYSFFNTDEKGDIFCPDGKGDLDVIVNQLCYISNAHDQGINSEWTFKPIRKLPLLYNGVRKDASSYYCGAISSLYFAEGVTATIALSSASGLRSITADSLRLYFNGFYNLQKLEYNDLVILGNTLGYAFSGLKCLDFSSITIPNTSNVTNMSNMFNDSYVKVAPTLNMSSCTSVGYMFSNCPMLTTIPDLTIPLATDFTQFCNASPIQTLNITAPKAAYFYSMLNSCKKLQSIGPLPTSNATSSGAYGYMFNQCLALTTLGLSQVQDKDGNTVNPWIFNYSVDFGYCPLNLASIKHVMENLASGVSSQTFKLSKTSKTYLEAEPATDGTSANLYEQLAAEAVSKGWTVSVNNSY